MSIESKFYVFHGKNPRKKGKIDFHVPKGLVVLGKAISIEYLCDKKNGGGDGKQAIYRHEFETPCIVAMDETSQKQIYVIGNRLKITDAGIEN